MNKPMTEIRGLDTAELRGKLNDLRKEKFQLRFRGSDEGAPMTNRHRDIRRSIARIMTVLGERDRVTASSASAEGQKQ